MLTLDPQYRSLPVYEDEAPVQEEVFVSHFTHSPDFDSAGFIRLLIKAHFADAAPQVLSSTISQINALSRLPENWNGGDVAAPNLAAIEKAVPWLRAFYDEAMQVFAQWMAPHVSASEDGDVVLEWWRESKSLTFYISPSGADYIKDAGDGLSEMEDGDASSPQMRSDLWLWLWLMD